jgi:hypothetical protein
MRMVFLCAKSEGPGLTDDDKRTYLGNIHNLNSEGLDMCLPSRAHNAGQEASRLCVEGSVIYGPDWESVVRSETVGTFIMREMIAQDDVEQD